MPLPERVRTRERFPIAAYLIPWFFVVACGLKVKLTLLRGEGAGYDFVAELLHRANGASLPWQQRLGLLREDLLFAGVLGSIVLVLMLGRLPARFRAVVIGVVSLVAFTIIYVELKCYWEVGTFLPARVIGAGIMGAGRELVGSYVTSATVARLLIAILLLVGMAVALYLVQRSAPRPRLDRWIVRISGAGLAAAAGIALATAFIPLPHSPYTRSALGGAVSTFLGRGSQADLSDEDFRTVGSDSLIALYARLANAPVPNAPSPYFAAARDHDVLVFLYESLPAACTRVAEAERAFANLRFLATRGFVAESHYATYPYSRRVYTSLYTGWYPTNGMRGLIETYAGKGRTLEAPGMVRSARLRGYETAAFVPEKPQAYELDAVRFAAVGFARHVVPASALRDAGALEVNDDSLRALHRVRDRESLDTLKAYVRRAVRAGHRYLYAFNPQLTHGPWPDIRESMTEGQVCRSGLPLFAEVDAMLGEIIDLLRQEGRLENTIIVAGGDHGLRTRRELPVFSGGTLDAITFQVPLVIWAPGVIDSTRHITWNTSHIDVAPSVLDLLGVREGRTLEMGSPLWDERISARKTYFLAQAYLGAAGYLRGDEAVMLKYLFGGVFRTRLDDELHFEADDILPESDSATQAVTRELHMLSKIQIALGRSMVRKP
jgi:hypothetical protein